ncbi:sugar phosphate isomerase/epimerase family protein [Chloroflexota bacterium]
MDRIAIEPNSHLGLPPLQAADLVASLGCRLISIWIASPGPFNPYNYPPTSLRDNAPLRREMIATMREKGVSISLIDGFMVIRPGTDVESFAGDLEIAKELGVPTLNTVSFEPDLGRAFDQLARLVDMADALGIETVVEFAPKTTLPDLASAVAAVQHVGRPGCRLLIDMMHLVRSGSGAADLAALDPDLIGYVHFCDAPLAPTMPNYLQEASSERLIPGMGEFPLSEILSVLPRDVVIGLEIPSVSKAGAGVLPYEHLVPAVEATRRLLAEIDG